MMNLWNTLKTTLTEDNDLELDSSKDTFVEDFVNGLNVYSKKAKECAILYIKDNIENDWVDDDGSLFIESVYEYAQFDSLQEIFDYILETGETSFEKEIRDDCSADLWSVYDYKLCEEVESILYEYNDEIV